MAHPLVWPSKYFFYAIGNTSAVSLITDLPVEEPARILLLGCGDPRNVLYTIFTQPSNSGRALDFTCCDFDPAVLARNVLLFTMLADGQPCATIWNIFFHFRLDKDSYTTLIDQCKELIGLSETIQKWRASPYASSIKISTEYTLTELRRHWTLYVDMQDLPKSRLVAIHNAFEQQSKESAKITTLMAARSLGPLGVRGLKTVISESFKNFWKTGVTFVDGKSIAAATILNPTFVYSLGGEGCSLHYGTDPLVPFHLAALFGNAKSMISMTEVVKAAKREFTDWCSSYCAALPSSSPPIVRFFVGEATAVCRALRAFGATGTLKLGVPVAQWKTQLIQLSGDEYTPASDGAPATFNVIHTSNLEDHIGLLNVLVASAPLLSTEPSSVLYTESLLFLGQDATKEFTEQLHADLSVIGLLVGLSPIDYLCGFSSRCNTHELMTYNAMKKDTLHVQFHQVTTWKAPTSGDTIASQSAGNILVPVFDGNQLGTLLYDIYQSLFEQQSARSFWANNQANLPKAISASNMGHYTREAFVLLLQLIRHRLQPSQDVWTTVMERFISLQLAAWSIQSMDTLHYQDFCGQLHRHSVYRLPFFDLKASKTGRFSLWNTVPDLVRIVLVIPREKLAVLEHSKAEEIGTPPLHCDIFGARCHNAFTAVHVAFGRAISVGTKSHPQIIFEQDAKGWAGDSPLVASFVAPAWLLSDLEPPEQLSVGFCVLNTPAACATLIKKLGLTLRIFTADLMDEAHVHVLPEYPLPSRFSPQSPPLFQSLDRVKAGIFSQIGESAAAAVELDEQCELIASLTARVSITDEKSVQVFSSDGSKVVPQISQLSPCTIRISLGDRFQDITYPFPVVGSAQRLRLARKSRYIEVIVPTSRSLMPDGMKLNPYPVINTNGLLHSWSIHRVNLFTLPILDVKAKQLAEWFNNHVGSMMSARERSLRKKHQVDTLMFVKDTLHSIFVRAAGTQGGSVQRLFALQDKKTKNCDTIFFIDDLRFDLAFHTMICDGYVLPLTKRLLIEIGEPFMKLVHQGGMVNIAALEGEMRAWKQLLPAFVERCRSSWVHGPNCEYRDQGSIPLTQGMEADPLCSCGRGKEAEGMLKVGLWKKFAPYVTRIALSPLFAVSYLETVGRDPDAHKCSVCRGRGKPKLKACAGCKKVRYCSPECQKKDWKAHKPKCKS
ncbi:hypothetical protein GALMADRAFT_122208 [Galerina marginata CBS 339.88]|uniref:MYND-type domain-containing protein n=1 Tax=Galerina marginata (strain CBS 339.88) TaxID=685588 RepID=A0A067SY90_GALM3|nr:hypothetical protein GALMADRAFT_122208 [Galerina marginata CBS 339.88]